MLRSTLIRLLSARTSPRTQAVCVMKSNLRFFLSGNNKIHCFSTFFQVRFSELLPETGELQNAEGRTNMKVLMFYFR